MAVGIDPVVGIAIVAGIEAAAEEWVFVGTVVAVASGEEQSAPEERLAFVATEQVLEQAEEPLEQAVLVAEGPLGRIAATERAEWALMQAAIGVEGTLQRDQPELVA